MNARSQPRGNHALALPSESPYSGPVFESQRNERTSRWIEYNSPSRPIDFTVVQYFEYMYRDKTWGGFMTYVIHSTHTHTARGLLSRDKNMNLHRASDWTVCACTTHSRTRVETAFLSGQSSEGLSDGSDSQRKLRTLVFLPHDHRDQNPRAGRSDLLPFRC